MTTENETTPMSEPMIDKLERLEREATGAPWNVQNTTACYDVIQGGDRTTDSRYIAMMGVDYDPNTGESIPPHADADAALIVAMRNALPALLSQLREQRELLRVNQDAHKKCDVLIDELGRQLAAAERTVREQREALERIMAIPHQLHHPNWSDMCAVCIALAALAPDTGGTNE